MIGKVKKFLSALLPDDLAMAVNMVVVGFATVVAITAITYNAYMDFSKEQSRDLRDAVVMIQPADGSGGLGSGVVISQDGLILTARHVVAGMNGKTKISMHNGEVETGTVLWESSEGLDLALVRLDKFEKPLTSVYIRRSPVANNEAVTVIGHPLGSPWVSTKGVVASDEPISVPYMNAPFASFLRIDATVAPGNSGGGVFDADGRLIGITSMMMVARTGGGFIQSASLVPIAFVVSNQAICTLLVCS